MAKVTISSNGAILALAAGMAGFKHSKKFYKGAGESAVKSIVGNIVTQQQADGSPIKRNSPETLAKKRKHGRPLMSLIDEFQRFVTHGKSWRIRLAPLFLSPKSVIITPTSYTGDGDAKERLKDLVKWVQQMKYVGWFGINQEGVEEIRASVRKEIKAMLSKVKSQAGAAAVVPMSSRAAAKVRAFGLKLRG